MSLQQLVHLLGVPHNINFANTTNDDQGKVDETEDEQEMDWYFSLQRTEEVEDESSEVLQIHISTNGRNCDYLGGLVASCLLHPETVVDEEWGMHFDESFLVFELIHHAAITEHLVTYLERTFSGFYFVTHHAFPSLFLEDEDSDILYFARQMCRHPMCMAVSSTTGYSPGELRRGEDEDYEYEGGGVLLGLDLEAIFKAVVNVSSAQSIVSRKTIDEIFLRLRSLDERMNVFISEVDYLQDREREMLCIMEISHMADRADSLDEYDSERDIAWEEQKKANAEAAVQNLNESYKDVNIKIVDLGNACWTYKHFTEDIQTRQYRAPEVLVGAGYDTSADMWSLGCMVFELLTGDLMFDPRAGKSWNREEDHLALIIELLGNFPRSLLVEGKMAPKYFNRHGELKHIRSLNYWGLREVLAEKYNLHPRDAEELADFLEPILEVCCMLLMRLFVSLLICYCMYLDQS